MSEVKVIKFKWLTPAEFKKIKALTNEYSVNSVAGLTKRSYNTVKGVADSKTFVDYKESIRKSYATEPKIVKATPEPDFEKLSIMQQLKVIEGKVDRLSELLIAQNDKLNIKKGWLGK